MSELDGNALFREDEKEILRDLGLDSSSEGAGDAVPEPAAEPSPAPEPNAGATPTELDPTQDDATSKPAEPATEPANAKPAPPQGDTRAALRASRRAEKRLRDQLAQLQTENEALRQGKPPEDASITDDDLAVLEEDFPLQAKIAKQQREILQRMQQAEAARAPAPEFEPMSYQPEVQEVIDTVPQLVAWQYDPAAQDKFKRAIDYDSALQLDPDWRDRNLADRFAEAARRAEAALKPATPTPAAPAANRQNPADVIANAPVQGPKGISDFRGGAVPNQPVQSYAGMTDEQILASLTVYP